MNIKLKIERNKTLYYLIFLFFAFMVAACEKDETGDEISEEVFEIVEEMPTFLGGDQELLNYITFNVKYPEEAKTNNTQGLVVIGFIVEIDGKISTIEILRDIGDGCGEEAKRVVESMPDWNPGMQRGEPVRVSYKLPVRFKLE